MARTKEWEKMPGTYVIHCPGCGTNHLINTIENGKPCWSFNGDLERPTFQPSLLVTVPDAHTKRPRTRCHSFIEQGRIRFLRDSAHKLAGKTVDLPEIAEYAP